VESVGQPLHRHGGAIGEIDRANEQIREVAGQGDDAGTETFFSSWIGMADRLVELADEAAAARFNHYRCPLARARR